VTSNVTCKGLIELARNFEDFIKSYVDTFAIRGEAPERFHFWCAVSTVAGALRRRVYIDEGTFRWYSNFYIVLVGPPGTVKKSSVINIGARLLRDVPNINIGADCTTWQKFVEEVARAKDMFAEGDPSQSQLEDFASQVHTVTCAVSLQISELGTFLNPDDREMINILTELWDCKIDQSFVKMTKTQGSDSIMNPFVNVIAGTTPQWMNDNFRGRFGGWGFSSRCIFLHASKPDRAVAYPHKSWRKGELDDVLAQFREDLTDISQLQGVYRLDTEAERLGEAWYSHHMDRKVALDSHPHHDAWLSYYLARKFDHIHKLAMVLAASRRSTLIIEVEDLKDAILRCDEIEDELSEIFATKESSRSEDKLRADVWNALSKAMYRYGGQIEQAEVYGFTLRWMSGGRVKELLSHLIEARWLERRVEGGSVFLAFGERAVIDFKKIGIEPPAQVVGSAEQQESVE
jgi:hypothetical protein